MIVSSTVSCPHLSFRALVVIVASFSSVFYRILWFCIVGYLRFHGGRSGSWCISEPAILYQIGLEFLWWVGVWFLLCHYEPSKLGDITVQNHIKAVKKYSEILFNNRIDPLSRRRAVIGSALLVNTDPQCFLDAVQILFVMLDEFREQLVTYYEIFKPTKTQEWSFLILIGCSS